VQLVVLALKELNALEFAGPTTAWNANGTQRINYYAN
jgi:hypothetical protein